jgi:hypothetical protein
MLIEQAQAQIERIKKKYLPMEPVSENDRAIIRRLEVFIKRQRAYEAYIRTSSV